MCLLIEYFSLSLKFYEVKEHDFIQLIIQNCIRTGVTRFGKFYLFV